MKSRAAGLWVVLLAALACAGLPNGAHAQMGTPPPQGPPAIRPPAPAQAEPPLRPPPGTLPAQPSQAPSPTTPAAPLHPNTPQVTIPLTRTPPPVPAASAPPGLQRSANETALARCDALAGARARNDCRRRASVRTRPQ